MNVAQLLHRVETAQREAATDAMERPGDTTFAYGRAVGFYAGLAMAKDIIASAYAEDETRRNRM